MKYCFLMRENINKSIQITYRTLHSVFFYNTEICNMFVTYI